MPHTYTGTEYFIDCLLVNAFEIAQRSDDLRETLRLLAENCKDESKAEHEKFKTNVMFLLSCRDDNLSMYVRKLDGSEARANYLMSLLASCYEGMADDPDRFGDIIDNQEKLEYYVQQRHLVLQQRKKSLFSMEESSQRHSSVASREISGQNKEFDANRAIPEELVLANDKGEGDESIDEGDEGDESIDEGDEGDVSIDAEDEGDVSIDEGSDGDESIDEGSDGDELIDEGGEGDELIGEGGEGDEAIDAEDEVEESIDAEDEGDELIDEGGEGDELIDEEARDKNDATERTGTLSSSKNSSTIFEVQPVEDKDHTFMADPLATNQEIERRLLPAAEPDLEELLEAGNPHEYLNESLIGGDNTEMIPTLGVAKLDDPFEQALESDDGVDLEELSPAHTKINL